MSRINKKFLKLGTGNGELNARDIPANFTSSSYTPSQAGTEGSDKLSAHLKGVDTSISAVNTHLTSVDGSISSINTHLTTVDGSISSVNTHLTTLDGSVSSINTHLTTVDGSISSINTHLTTVDNSISTINTHLTAIDNSISSIVGGVNGDIALTSASLLNNQFSTNVTGLAFSNSVTRSARVHYSIVVSATSSLYEAGNLLLIQKGSNWEVAQTSVGDATGIVFSVTSSGQVQYTSPSFAGFSSAGIKFRAETTTV